MSFVTKGGRREKECLYQQTYISHIYYHITDAFYDNYAKSQNNICTVFDLQHIYGDGADWLNPEQKKISNDISQILYNRILSVLVWSSYCGGVRMSEREKLWITPVYNTILVDRHLHHKEETFEYETEN